MFEITVKGRNLAEFKKNVQELNDELNGVNVINVSADKLTVENIKPSEIEELPANDSFETPDPTPTIVAPIVEAPVAEAVVEAPVAEPSVASVSPELDAAGLPWDKRIHSSGKTISVSKGTWNKRRSISPELVAQVEAELRAVTSIVPESAVITTPITPAQEVVIPATVPAPVEPIAQPVIAPTVNDGPSQTLESFTANFHLILARLITNGKVTQEYIESLKAYFNVAQICDVTDAQKGELYEGFVNSNIITRL